MKAAPSPFQAPILSAMADLVNYSSISSIRGVYNSSITPASLPWNTYNYCNAPHVNAAHYSMPDNASDAVLVYINAVLRHHKVLEAHYLHYTKTLSHFPITVERTPDNLYPDENELNSVIWNCSDFFQFSYGGGSTRIFHETESPSWHPFLSQIWNGTCDEGQLTQEGLEDAIHHGKVRVAYCFSRNERRNVRRTFGRYTPTSWGFCTQ